LDILDVHACAMSGDAPARPPPPGMPEMDDYAKSLLGKLDAIGMAPGIAAVEQVPELDKLAVKSIGTGSSTGIRLVDIVDPADAALARSDYAKALIAADRRLLRFAPGEKGARAAPSILKLSRVLGAMTDEMKMPPLSSASGGSSTGSTTSYVVSQSEEERGFSVPTYSLDEVKSQSGVLVTMYNAKLTPNSLPSVAKMKKVCYWVRQERS